MVRTPYHAHPVFPCGHHKKNAAAHCYSEVEIAFLPFDDFHSKVHWIIEDDPLCLFRQDGVTRHMADIRFVPIKLYLGSVHAP